MMTSSPWALRGKERRWRCDHNVRDRRKLVRRLVGDGHERPDHFGRGRQDQHPAHDRWQLVQAELESRRDAEVAAAAADRPEQIRMRFVVGMQHFAVRGHDLGGEQVVDGQPVKAGEEADASTERETADTDDAGIAEAGGQTVLAGCGRVLGGGEPCLRPRSVSGGVDLDCLERGEIEDDAALRDAMAGQTVAAAADGQLC
jgi:hypothetical protein